MASSLDRLRSLNNADRLRATAPEAVPPAAAAAAPFMAPRPSPTLERTYRAGTQPAPLSKEILPMVLEGAGAAGGAALGGMVAGIPGAIVGGAGGARLGQYGGRVLEGEPEKAEMTAATIGGGLGGASGTILRLGSRLLAQIPSASRAVAQATREAHRRGAAAAISRIDTELGELEAKRAAAAAREKYAEMEARFRHPGTATNLGTGQTEAVPPEIAAQMRTSAAKAAEAMQARLKELRGQIADPERAVERARAKIMAANGPSGTVGLTVGALLGHVLGGGVLEATISGGTLGYLLGRLESRLAVRLANSPEFVRWASGLKGRTWTDALASGATDVRLHSLGDDGVEFYNEMADLVTGAIAGSQAPEAAGSKGEAQKLLDDAMRAGERTWEELVGSRPAEGHPFTAEMGRRAAEGLMGPKAVPEAPPRYKAPSQEPEPLAGYQLGQKGNYVLEFEGGAYRVFDSAGKLIRRGRRGDRMWGDPAGLEPPPPMDELMDKEEAR